MIYENGKLKEILTPEGVIQNGFYYYYLKDHLGNNRIMINSKGLVVEQSHYYPSGMRFYWESTSNSAAIPFRLGGKEYEAMNGLNQYDNGARRRFACLPLTTTMDPLCEKRPWESGYCWLGNNYINRIDPTGMYYNDENEKKAAKIEQQANNRATKLENQANKLEAKGKSTGDLRERAGELRQSAQDIEDMRSNPDVEFQYAKASNKSNPAGVDHPNTVKTGVNDKGNDVVTMFTEGNVANQIHESRHGGQVARGEYSFDQHNNPTAGYGLASEVSAYKAQYSYNGQLNYIDATSELNQQIASKGIIPPTSAVVNIINITPDFVKTRIGEFGRYQIPFKEEYFYGIQALYGNLK